MSIGGGWRLNDFGDLSHVFAEAEFHIGALL
jgi:hypothetical protein